MESMLFGWIVETCTEIAQLHVHRVFSEVSPAKTLAGSAVIRFEDISLQMRRLFIAYHIV